VSEQDAELVRRHWEEFIRRAVGDAAVEGFAAQWWDTGIVYEEDPRWPGSGTYTGVAAVRGAFESYRDVLGTPDFKVERVLAGPGGVVALIRVAGRTPGSEVPWDHLWGYLCRLNEGRIGYLRAYWDPDEALAAAGVSSP